MAQWKLGIPHTQSPVAKLRRDLLDQTKGSTSSVSWTYSWFIYSTLTFCPIFSWHSFHGLCPNTPCPPPNCFPQENLLFNSELELKSYQFKFSTFCSNSVVESGESARGKKVLEHRALKHRPVPRDMAQKEVWMSLQTHLAQALLCTPSVSAYITPSFLKLHHFPVDPHILLPPNQRLG